MKKPVSDISHLFVNNRLADDGLPIVPVITLHLANAVRVTQINVFGTGFGDLAAATIEINGVKESVPVTSVVGSTGVLNLTTTSLASLTTSTIVLRDFVVSPWYGSLLDQFSLTELTVDGTIDATPPQPPIPPSKNEYSAQDLGNNFWAAGINDRGRIVGTSESELAIWENGVITKLGNYVDGGIQSINDRGQIVGNAYGAMSFLWEKGVITGLPGSLGDARDINNRGQIIGNDWTGSGLKSFLWQKGVITDLGDWWVRAINDDENIVGSSSGEQQHATLWKKGKITDLGTLPGKSSSDASDINNDGQIVGYSYSLSDGNWAQEQRATLWEKGHIIDLGILPGGTFSVATGINNRGEIIGYGDTESGMHAILWTKRATDGKDKKDDNKDENKDD